jgi:hypothetical protein
MAEPLEDKGFLGEKLEEDRQKMAVQVAELKEDYNVVRKLRASVQKNPWPWTVAALLVGFLLSRLPARRKEVLLWTEPLQRMPSRELPLPPTPSDNDESSETEKLLSLAKWAIDAYLVRELDRRLIQPSKYLAERIGRSDRVRRQTERFLHEFQNWIEEHGQFLPSSLRDRLDIKGSFLGSLLRKTPIEKLMWQLRAKPRRFWNIFS